MSAPFTEPRPKREDLPDEVDASDVLHELRLLGWEWRYWRSEVNGDLGWLRLFITRMSELGRVLLVLLPVVVSAVIAIHMFR